jgi:hypothetical protein
MEAAPRTFLDCLSTTVVHLNLVISVLAALTYPVLFSSLILVDPVIAPKRTEEMRGDRIWDLTLGALQRRETWNTR